MKKVGIVGATGYTGLELLRVLSFHPNVDVVFATSERFSGRPLGDVIPFLSGSRFSSLELVKSSDAFNMPCDLVFLALPHEVSSKVAPIYLNSGAKVVDLSAAFRMKNISSYEAFYGKHWSPELLSEAVYGIPELFREVIKESRLVANPGCYPTSVVIPLYPLKREGILKSSSFVIVDSKSGVSGAGREPSMGNMFSEVNESVKAYKTGVHRHQPEMEEVLGLKVLFSPHLVPMDRGILSTIYLAGVDADPKQVFGILEEFYSNEPFVRVFWGKDISTKEVRGTNLVDISVKETSHGVVIVSTIDNLVKGASGQAIQNMNVLFGFDEGLSLSGYALFP